MYLRSSVGIAFAIILACVSGRGAAHPAFPSKPVRIVVPVTTGGHTLLQAAASMAINPFLMSDLPYDTVKDFAPISLAHLTPYVFVVSAQSPINMLAVTTPQRNAVFPAIPTAIESGAPGFDFASWGGLFAPAATPRPVVMQLNAEVRKALGGEALKKRFDDMGLVAKASSPEEFGQFLVSEMNRWKGLVKKAP